MMRSMSHYIVCKTCCQAHDAKPRVNTRLILAAHHGVWGGMGCGVACGVGWHGVWGGMGCGVASGVGWHGV